MTSWLADTIGTHHSWCFGCIVFNQSSQSLTMYLVSFSKEQVLAVVVLSQRERKFTLLMGLSRLPSQSPCRTRL